MLLLNKKSISIFILICFVIVALPTLIVALNQTQGMGGHVSLNEESQQHAAVSKIDKQKSVSVSQANRNTAVSDDDDQNVTVSDIQPSKVGQELDSYKGVPVYFNGTDYTKSYGESFNSDGYYFGLKWQCVEFVKRFYYEVKGHEMPNSFGNAKDFFDPNLPQGSLNPDRGLIQFRNGGNVKPQPDDILVFTDGQYGHVGIVTKVTADSLEIIQQNETTSRAVFPISVSNGHYFVGSTSTRIPAGWLRQE